MSIAPTQLSITGSVLRSLAPEHSRADPELRRHSLPGRRLQLRAAGHQRDVGATQYVQMVNEGYQVFDKATGNSVLGPNSIQLTLERLRRRLRDGRHR